MCIRDRSVPIIKDIIRAYRIPILEVPGYEADDVIGTPVSYTHLLPERVLFFTAHGHTVGGIEESTRI